MCCVKYGVTGDYVLALQVVTGTGELVRIGRATAKGVAGYDLASLLVGSEGTLGLVTEVTVRLRPHGRRNTPSSAFFDSLVGAGGGRRRRGPRRAGALGARAARPALPRAVDDWKNLGIEADAEAILLARVDAPGAAGVAEAEAVLECFEAAGATWAARSEDDGRGRSDVRRPPPRLPRPGTPRTRYSPRTSACRWAACPRCSPGSRPSAMRHDVLIANIAHAGDGNLHPLLITPPGDEAARVRAQAAFDEIIAEALACGGTVTGEHGVGLLKRDGLTAELSPAVVDMHRAIRRALDPHGHPQPRQSRRLTRRDVPDGSGWGRG